MHSFITYAAAAAAIGGLSAPLAAQNPYPYGVQQPVPQPYPGQPGYGYQQAYPGYPQQGYAYGQQGYAQNPVNQIIDQLLGNRYNVTDRQAVSQCASAAMTQAAAQYGNGYNRGYGNNGRYQQGYAPMRVTAITDVQRRNNGLRVSGTMSSNAAYAGQYGYQNRNYAAANVGFRCNVDYRGAVTNVRIGRNMAYGR
jgi:hypothetical protein